MAYTTINKSTDHFNTVTYTGNGSTQSITGVNFKPDWVWIKDRIGATSVYSHHLFDVIRGSTKYLLSNATDAEATDVNTLTSFDSDGFSLGSDASTNASGDATVAWNWKANGAGSSNTDGSITSTVSANTTSGFSIVRWSGTAANASIGHNLGAVPKMIICKDTSDTYNWGVYHVSLGNTKYLYLNSTNAEATTSSVWNNTTPTSTVFSVGNAGATNASGTDNMIAYCFAEKKGFSKFGSYTGNGNADGVFCFTGMKPSFVMIKSSTNVENWIMFDNKRNGFNVQNRRLYPNTSGAEGTSDDMDILSNGFKIRDTGGVYNASGATYIYAAFAEAPLVGSNNIPCTAR